MPLTIDDEGRFKLAWEFSLLSEPAEFPGAADAVVARAQDLGNAAFFSRPGEPAQPWHRGMGVAIACIDPEGVSPENGCSGLFIAPSRDDDDGVEQWTMRCELIIDQPALFVGAARDATARWWGEAIDMDSLEAAAYEIFVASNARAYSPADAGLTLLDPPEGEATVEMAMAWWEAREIKALVEPPQAPSTPSLRI